MDTNSKIEFCGVELHGCTRLTGSHQNPATRMQHGADGGVTVIRQHDTGAVTITFGDRDADGHDQLTRMRAAEPRLLKGELRVTPPDGESWSSPAWLDVNETRGTTWVLGVTALPRSAG